MLKEALAEPSQADEHLWHQEYLADTASPEITEAVTKAVEEAAARVLEDIVDKANKERAMHPGLEPLPKTEPVKAKAPRKPSQRKKQAIIKESIKHTTDVEKEDK